MWYVGVVSLMPEMFQSLDYGVVGRAIDQGIAKVSLWNPREWASRPYRQVDDKPYGGGPGMVMLYEPLHAAIECAKSQMPEETQVIYLSPQGQVVTQAKLNQIAAMKQSLIFVAGRYEGIDERVIAQHVDEEWSLGDYVLSGGELAAMVFIDAVVRLLPGSLGHQASAQLDSFMNGLLDCPHYSRPAVVGAASVPKMLLEGNHREIERWRRKQSLGQTWLKRPDLLEQLKLNDSDMQLLVEFKTEYEE
ncbi:MAG: tRNA (guanosine(37)-N1)-methyltransferase TrmD [Legionellales bacterium]|nr:tRNA (guanosine(37)-N1)-methyltransferase TrmD [Legionellales bacterium]